MASVTYLAKKDDKIIFTGKYMEAYIPDKLFKKGLNEYMGDEVSIMGIFNFRLGDKDGNIDPKSRLYTFNFPSMMMTKPSSVEKKETEILPGTGVKKYHVLKYYAEDYVMVSRQVIQGIDNVEKFVNLLLEAALPTSFKYEDILRIFLKNLEINKETAGVSATSFSMIVAESSRYKKDLSIPFRKLIGKGKANQYDYILANARTVCANNSTFSGMTFEDIDSMTVSAVNKKRYNRTENESPVEQIIRV